jgi:hypothetical protein
MQYSEHRRPTIVGFAELAEFHEGGGGIVGEVFFGLGAEDSEARIVVGEEVEVRRIRVGHDGAMEHEKGVSREGWSCAQCLY